MQESIFQTSSDFVAVIDNRQAQPPGGAPVITPPVGGGAQNFSDGVGNTFADGLNNPIFAG